MYKLIGFCLLLSFASLNLFAKKYSLCSPDGKLRVVLHADDGFLTWEVAYTDAAVLQPSRLGLKFQEESEAGLWVKKVRNKEVSVTRQSSFYKRSSWQSEYRETELTFRNNIRLQIRAYNQGAAYRFVNSEDSVILSDEVAEFVFDKDYSCQVPYVCDLRDASDQYCSAFESLYSFLPFSSLKADSLSLSPLLVCLDGNRKALIGESGLKDYPGMFLKKAEQANYGVEADFARYPLDFYVGGFNQLNEMPQTRADYIARLSPGQCLPWRIVAVSTDDSQLLGSDLVYELGGECQLDDTSWIKPGKAAWDWWNDWNITGVDFKAGCNTQTYKHYVDFASRYGLEYLVVDEGWSKNAKDMSELNPNLDLVELIRYADEKNVGIILWASYLGFIKDTDYYLEHYAKMGIKGFKIDFFDRDDQPMVKFCYELAEKAARHHLVLDLHGMFKPSGLNVCYPNVLSFEGVRGLENCKWHNYDMPAYDVTMPFIRMAAGPVDYTPGAMNNAARSVFRPVTQQPMSMGTRVHQLASYVVFDSPLQMLCDSPTFYERNVDCTRFIASVPTVFDEYVPLQSKVGKYLSVAKRKGDEWFVGALTNWDKRTITIDFSFLPAGTYKATVFTDGINADRNATDYRKTEITVTSDMVLKYDMASGGGVAMRIQKL